MKITIETKMHNTLRGELTEAELTALLSATLKQNGVELPADAVFRFYVHGALGSGDADIDYDEPLRFAVTYSIAAGPGPLVPPEPATEAASSTTPPE